MIGGENHFQNPKIDQQQSIYNYLDVAPDFHIL